MSGSYIQSAIQCPFYREEKGDLIRCESIVDAGWLDLHYRKQSEKLTQLRVFCSGRYTNCEIYQAIMAAKYLD